MSGKGSPVRVLAVAALLLITLSAACRLKPKPQTFPIDLKQVIPEDWAPLRIEEADWDGDGDNEWLLLYRYNTPNKRGPIGGVIYDAQVGLQAGHGGLRLPTRPAFLIPYPLLPSSQTGEGFLGLKDIETRRYDADGDDRPDEIVFLGRAYDGQVAFVSIFQWQGAERGYLLVNHFAGDGGVEVSGETEPTKGEALYQGRIDRVIVRTHTRDRSLLCRKEVYRRKAGETAFKREEPPRLAFAYGTPDFPVYPEGAVLAYYLALDAGDSKKAESCLLTEEEIEELKDIAPYLRTLRSWVQIPPPPSHPKVVELCYKGRSDLTLVITRTVESRPPVLEYADVRVRVIGDQGPWEGIWLVVNISADRPRQGARWKLVGVYP